MNSGVPCSVQGRPHSSAEGLLEGSEMEHQRTERIPFGSNGVGFDEKGFGQQAVNGWPFSLSNIGVCTSAEIKDYLATDRIHITCIIRKSLPVPYHYEGCPVEGMPVLRHILKANLCLA